MALLGGRLGFRVSEIVRLQWKDFDFRRQTVLVQRSVVHGPVDAVKAEYSQDHMPLDEAIVEALLKYRDRCSPTADGWLFANPVTDKPYHQQQIQKTHIRKAAAAAGIGWIVGWHTFRHSYRSWLCEAGVSSSVQKELMRHASIQTTVDVYGKVMTETKRQADSKVVEMVLKPDSRAVRAEPRVSESTPPTAFAAIGS